jgi:hypothetical protein
MQYPQSSREPSGCLQTIFITKAILGVLFIPLGLVLGAIIIVVMTFYAFTVHPLLGLGVIVGGVAALITIAKWESRRIAREMPRDDDR